MCKYQRYTLSNKKFGAAKNCGNNHIASAVRHLLNNCLSFVDNFFTPSDGGNHVKIFAQWSPPWFDWITGSDHLRDHMRDQLRDHLFFTGVATCQL